MEWWENGNVKARDNEFAPVADQPNISRVSQPGRSFFWGRWLGFVRDLCEAIWKSLCPPARKRLELRFLPYAEADKLLREPNSAWKITKGESNNRRAGWVYLERREEYPRFDRACGCPNCQTRK